MITSVHASVPNFLPCNKQGGLKHLYLEHDAVEVTPKELRREEGSYGEMINKAESLGITIHLYDDRTEQRALAKQFPEEAQQVKKNDPYFKDTEALIAEAKNPEHMHAFIDATAQQLARLEPRNHAIAAHLDHSFQNYAEGKSAVILGGGHMNAAHDVDEALRAHGHHITTVEINSPQSSLKRGNIADPADMVIAAETGNPLAYKDPSTGTMQRAMEGVDLPWKNTQPVLECNPQTSLNSSATPHVSTSREGNCR